MENVFIRKNPNEDVVNKVLEAITNNEGYCPCKLEHTSDTKCMCAEFRNSSSGLCHCGLYEKFRIPFYKYVAVDFDGTLCEHKFPDIGAPNERLIEYLRILHNYGSKIILYTCREDNEVDMHGNKRMYLTEALNWCRDHKVPIDAANENPWVPFGGRKIYADIYVDDRGVHFKDFVLGGDHNCLRY